ncbi:PASTA domain-containing protein [Anaerobacillus sp. HL2]|nr:PASTA domain-containing protein [Anaerobacillus sp. HL2]
MKVGSPITVFISEGKEKIEMVDITRQDKDLARKTLIGLGFMDKNIIEIKQETTEMDENTVISHEPIVGSLIVPEETLVYLTYSVTPIMRLENLQGYKRDEVSKYLQENKLSGEFAEDYSNRFPEGEVMEQIPARNEFVRKGDVIKVIFSLGPKPKPVPEPVSTFIEFEVPVSEEDPACRINLFCFDHV